MRSMSKAERHQQVRSTPIGPVLEFIYRRHMADVFWCNCIFEGENDIRKAMPLGYQTDEDAVRVVMFIMKKRGLIKCCCCGCHGYIEITGRGEDVAADAIIARGESLPDFVPSEPPALIPTS